MHPEKCRAPPDAFSSCTFCAEVGCGARQGRGRVRRVRRRCTKPRGSVRQACALRSSGFSQNFSAWAALRSASFSGIRSRRSSGISICESVGACRSSALRSSSAASRSSSTVSLKSETLPSQSLSAKASAIFSWRFCTAASSACAKLRRDHAEAISSPGSGAPTPSS